MAARSSSLMLRYIRRRMTVMCVWERTLYPGSTKFISCLKPEPSTVAIGRKSWTINSAIFLVMSLTRSGEHCFDWNECRVSCCFVLLLDSPTVGCLDCKWLSRLVVPLVYVNCSLLQSKQTAFLTLFPSIYLTSTNSKESHTVLVRFLLTITRQYTISCNFSGGLNSYLLATCA